MTERDESPAPAGNPPGDAGRELLEELRDHIRNYVEGVTALDPALFKRIDAHLAASQPLAAEREIWIRVDKDGAPIQDSAVFTVEPPNHLSAHPVTGARWQRIPFPAAIADIDLELKGRT